MYTIKVPLQSARLSEALGTHATLERACVDVTLVVHDQACALDEDPVTAHRSTLLLALGMLIIRRSGGLLLLVQALEVSLIHLLCLIVNDQFPVDVLRKDFESRVARSTGHVELWLLNCFKSGQLCKLEL